MNNFLFFLSFKYYFLDSFAVLFYVSKPTVYIVMDVVFKNRDMIFLSYRHTPI